MKINSLLAGTLALVLVAGMASPAFAQAPASSGSTPASTQVSVPQGAATINFDTFSFGDIPIGNEYAAQGILFSTPDLNLRIGTTAGSPPSSLGAAVTAQGDFDGDVVFEFIGSNCASDVEFLIFNTPFSATAFDISGNTLATLNSGGNTNEIFSFAGLPVHKVQTTGSGYAIDDVTFTLESCGIVGGESLSLDSTALILAGAQTNAVWIMSALALVGSVAFGALYITSKKN